MICTLSSWCHCHSLSLASLKSRMVYLSGAGLPGLSRKKRLLNGCSSISSSMREGRTIVMNVSVCWFVCLSLHVHVPGTTRLNFTKFLCLLPVAMTWSLCYGHRHVAIRYVLRFCGWRHVSYNRPYSGVAWHCRSSFAAVSFTANKHPCCAVLDASFLRRWQEPRLLSPLSSSLVARTTV